MKKRKITLTIIICLIGCMVLGISAAATGTGRRANLKSAGSIDVQIDNQEIYISSSDFRYLADEIDSLENTYKMNIVDALNSIGTYFKADGTAVYNSGLNEVNTAEEKIAIKFNRLREAISSSQSITSLSQTQATDKEGNLLFYVDEAARDQENLLKTTIVDTGFPVYYRPATEENLTAGAAAWVDGTLIKGNGSNNIAYYEQGGTDAIRNVDIYFSTFALRSWNATNSVTAKATLTAPKTGRVCCYYVAYGESTAVSTSGNISTSNASGLNGLVKKGSTTPVMVEMDVVENYEYSIQSTYPPYNNVYVLFWFTYI